VTYSTAYDETWKQRLHCPEHPEEKPTLRPDLAMYFRPYGKEEANIVTTIWTCPTCKLMIVANEDFVKGQVRLTQIHN